MAGSLKRGYPDVDEDLTLIRALVDSNVPKFLADDLPLFAAIVKVIFSTRWFHIKRAFGNHVQASTMNLRRKLGL